MSEKQAIKIGDPIWVFVNWQWSQLEVVGETSRSWILDGGNPLLRPTWRERKMPKKNPNSNQFLLSLKAVRVWEEARVSVDRERAWNNKHSYAISRDVSKLSFDKNQLLRQIAALIGYDDGESGVSQ